MAGLVLLTNKQKLFTSVCRLCNLHSLTLSLSLSIYIYIYIYNPVRSIIPKIPTSAHIKNPQRYHRTRHPK